MATITERKAKDGSPSYRVEVRLKGHPIQRATFERKTDAKRWAASVESAIKEGRHFKTTEAKKHTLTELIDRYIKEVLPGKASSMRVRQTLQLGYWKAELGAYALTEITPQRIAETRDKLLLAGDKPRTPATANRYSAALSVAMNHAAKVWGWIDDAPTRNVPRKTEPRGRIRFLSDDERERLLAACKASYNPLLYPAVVLSLSTGMRQGECMNLYWREPKTPPAEGAWGTVHLDEGKIILHETKNGERRIVPLSASARAILVELGKVRLIDNDLLFPGEVDGKPIDLRKAWLAAMKAADIEGFHWHDLRHTFASYLAMSGATLAELAEAMGHKSLQMVFRYAHLCPRHQAGVVDRMAQKFLSQAG
ncbi:MAG: site-specific integrase [Methylococcaceae bacterium]|nr:MAG: site-specific integrase [Methylococcaceae bacterium]